MTKTITCNRVTAMYQRLYNKVLFTAKRWLQLITRLMLYWHEMELDSYNHRNHLQSGCTCHWRILLHAREGQSESIKDVQSQTYWNGKSDASAHLQLTEKRPAFWRARTDEGTADRLEEKQHFSRSSSQKLVIPFGKRTVFNPSIKSNVPIG